MNFLTFFLLFTALSSQAQIDQQALPHVKALFERLTRLSLSFKSEQKILLGHQSAFNEGRGWRHDNNDIQGPLRSDMHDATGLHPAVYGIDFLEVVHWNKSFIIDRIRKVHSAGGVITFSWHLKTLIDDGRGTGNFDDVTTKVVEHILPGGRAHDKFKAKLDEFANLMLEIHDVPIILRPWHEHNASWFWWGKKHCTVQQYIDLWRFTVRYLQSRGVHNLLYAYSPARIKQDYFDRWPGDDFVDIMGVDFYFKDPRQDQRTMGRWPLLQWKKDLITLMREAHGRNKIPAITEMGQEGIVYPRFWTDYYGWPIERAGVEQITGPGNLPGRGVAYIMAWRNDPADPKHFFSPFPGHNQNENFMRLLSKSIFLGL
jgi:mannan endo-1,4-beta-mannosidase